MLYHADKIIGITHNITCSFGLWYDFLFKPQVKYIVQEYIGKYRTEITALRCPLSCCHKLICINVTCFEKSSNKQKHALVQNANLQASQYPVMRNIVKQTPDIRLYGIADTVSPDCFVLQIALLFKSRIVYFLVGIITIRGS